MKKNQQFGTNLRELRTGLGLTLRELADRVNVDLTYLSKIEKGAMPPPSEKVILRLAENLNIDKDELLILAGKIPSDIAEILKDREVLQLLRSARIQKKVEAQEKRKESVHRLRGFKYLPEAIIHNKVARVAVATILTVLVGTLVWFAAPTTDTAVALNNEGLDYNYAGEYYKAIDAFNKAIELDPNLAIAYNNRGWAYIELGQYEQGIADCNKAIELDPNLALAYSNRGLAYIRLGQYEQGAADCNRAIELDPFLAVAYSNRGLAYIELGKYEQAIADFDKAVELDPTLLK